ncbi:DUF445 domain-containing protein [Nocardioides alcanivorans]|uniref:DUF445 domain-containing protein n=1 Tax=Nocardioides alcanivorans TaxID=2897352 RepID=UPI001F3887AA|nr:DUF445 domain-containing protein [Nocardioides alcanivorans]
MTLPLVTPAPEADAERRRSLRRMRSVALGLLVLAAVVYVLTRDSTGFLGYVNAGAEASMVGAIADWFAVTALFRHPLGLPVPHTALIPRRKDDLGRGLEEFVGENFLQPGIITERVQSAEPTRRFGAWLAHPAHSARVVAEGSVLARTALSKIEDRHVVELVEQVLVPRFREEPIAPVLGTFVVEAVRDDLHHGLVDLAVSELHDWLVVNHETFTDILAERAPWWAPPKLNDAVTSRLHSEAVRWLVDIRDDPQHRARAALDSLLARLGDDLLHDETTAQRAENLKLRLLEHPQMVATGVSLWKGLRNVLRDALADPEGALATRVRDELVRLGTQMRDDTAMQQRFDRVLSDATVFVVERYGQEVTSVITQTIERWDGKEAAERIELHVGRDLQFIRINGTVVGGLVGVLIHAASHFL